MVIKKLFISGSRKISRLNEEIRDFLTKVMEEGTHVLVGDASGVDRAVQKYLKENKYDNVTIYFSGANARNKLADWSERPVKTSARKNSYEYYTAKDKEMAMECDMGLAIWDGNSRGTLENIFNVLKNNKEVIVYFLPEKRFFEFKKQEEAKWLIEIFNKPRKKNKFDLSVIKSGVSHQQTTFKFNKQR